MLFFGEPLEARMLLAINPGLDLRPPGGGPIRTGPEAAPVLNQWPSYTTVTNDLNYWIATYPSITRLISIGKTVQNRDIWALEISDNPGVDEDEPEFYYNGQIHGDEPVGMNNSRYFIDYLLSNYGTSSRVTSLINNMDLWIVPSINWDGYMRNGGGSGNAWRYNANGVDLNRNFPEWTTRSFSSNTRYFGPYGNMYDGPAPQTALLQPETVAAMNFMKSHNFVAAANFHGGDLVANYPWDSDGSVGANYAVAPDDALLKAIALVYSTPNTPMYNNNTSPFVHGTTNGDNWYPISGGMQDWNYIYTGTSHLTVELGFTKYPSASQLPTLWSQNQESMLQFMEAGNWGVRGLVTSSVNGAPLFAKVTMTAPAPSPTPDPNHPSTHPVFTDPDIGDYHRQLVPGTYTLKFEAAGYQTKTISNVVVASNTNDGLATLRLDVALDPIDNVAPTVQSGAFAFNGAPQSLSFTFSEQVQGVDNTDLILTDNTHGGSVPSSSITLESYNPTTHVARFTFNYPGGTLPGASYSASFNTAGITDTSGNPLAAGFAYNFIYAAGTAGNDSIYARRDGGGNLSVWQNANPNVDPATYTAPFATLANFSMDGFGGDDTLALDFSQGEVRPAGPSGFGYRLGTQNETLTLLGSIPGGWTFLNDPAIETPNLSLLLYDAASVEFAGARSHLVALSLQTGATASVAPGDGRVLVTGSLQATGGSTLDLNDNDMIVFYSGSSLMPSIQGFINSGRNSGLWDGTGITSSAAQNATPRNTTLGTLEATDYKAIYGPTATFDGEVLPGNAILVKYTYYGDADFNGRVNFDDYARTDAGFVVGRTGWLNGDFDGNGLVNFDDYALIDLAFNTQGSAL